MRSGALDIGSHAPSYVLRLLLRNLADLLGRDTDDEAPGGELPSFGHDGPGRHYRALAYLGPVEDRSVYPNEASVPDLTSVHDCLVTDHAPPPTTVG